MTPAVRILGEFTDYAGLQELMRQRADGLNLSHETIEILANCTPGLSGKILAPRPSKRLGPENMGNFLPALGVKLIMVQDDDATAEIERRLKLGIIKNRNPNLANHSGVVIARFSRRQMRRNGKKGGTNSRKYMTREAASDLARAAVQRRKWRTPKVVEITKPIDKD